MSTYREVMALAKDFADTSSVKDRRAHGKRLMDLLSKQEVRHRIYAEATGTEAARQYALTSMWRNIVTYTTLATAAIGSGTGKNKKTKKWTKDDISVFYNIIMYCDEPRDESIFRLSRNEVKSVIRLCEHLLCHEEVVAVQGAEAILLNLLAYIAGSKGYIANLWTEAEIKMILIEVEKRISGVDEMMRTLAAKIFQNLCQTAESLGIQLHSLMSASVKMVAAWCTESYRETSHAEDVGRRPVAEMNPLISGLSAMVRSCPEQAIAPLTRHGRAILKFAKARYRQEPDPTAINVLNEFFLCYLLVSQVAGIFQGLMPGDLGDLGDASVKPRLLRDLLEIITTKNPTRAFASKKSDDDLFQWPLDKFEQTQLELTARLLACSQRLFLMEAERKQMDSPERTFMAIIDSLPNRDDFLPLDQGEGRHVQPCAPNVMSTSPFVKLILQPLHDFAPRKSLDMRTPMHQGGTSMSQHGTSLTQYGDSQSLDVAAPSQRYTQSQAFLSQRETQDLTLSDISPPLLENMATNVAERKTDANTVKRLLQTLGACAEIFPAGSCWTSQSQSCWRDLPSHGDDDPNVEVRQALVCIPDDLAAIITTIANILEAHGDVSGDASVQQWTLRCLQRLTEATSSLSLFDKKSPLDSIKSAWRRVWTILFRPDFRYMVCTRACTPESTGDLVLRLLSLMARHFCVDPEVRWSSDIHKKQATFLYQRQTDIWNLPIFVHLHEPSVVSKFDLIISLLFSVGLAEGGDSIALGLQAEGFDAIQLPNRGRRYRLVNVCLHCLAHTENPEMIGIAATCAAALSHGDRSPWSMTLTTVTTESSLSRTLRKPKRNDVTGALNLFESLWCTRQTLWQESRQGAVAKLDPTLICSSKVTIGIAAADEKLKSADILAKSQVVGLADELHPRLERAIQFSKDGGDEDADSGTLQVPLSLLRMKTRLTVALSCGHDQVVVELESIAAQLTLLLETISTSVEGSSQILGGTLADILKILTFIVQATSFPRVKLPSSVTQGANILCEKLENALDAYTGMDVSQLPSAQKVEMKIDLEADSDSDIDDSVSDKPSKRSRRPHGREVKRRRTEAPSAVVLDPNTALVVANLILLLKPSVSSAKFVAETVLGVDMDRHAQAPDVGAFDLIAGATISELFKTFSALRDKESRDSVASLIPMLIKMIRSNASPESELHLFGFDLCADVVVKCEGIRHPELSASESADLLSVWKDLTSHERRSQSLRPVLRATSLRTMAMAFVQGKTGGGLHTKWLSSYPPMILQGVRDVSHEVRRQASVAVTASLVVKSLSQEKLMESLFRNLPPISTKGAKYKSWYMSITQDDVSLTQMWEDAKSSVESGVLYCWASIGGRTANSREQRRILFRLIQTAHCRPDLEAACFQALDYMAHMAGFGKAESMVSECVIELSKMWHDERNEHSFLELPLLMTAPKAVRFLIRSGFVNTRTGTPTVAGLRAHAAAEFVRKKSHHLLPLHLAAPKEPISDDIHLRDLCSVHTDAEDFGDSILAKLVKKYLPGIIAYCASLQCGSRADQETAIAIHRRVEALLSEGEVKRVGSRRAAIVVRGILENLGSTYIATENLDEVVGRFSQEVEDAANRFGTVGRFDPFSRTGSSLAEHLLYATSWLRQDMAEWTRQQRFQVMALLTNIAINCIRRGDHGKMQLGFFVHVFSELLSDHDLSSIHRLTLSLLQETLKELLLRCAGALPSKVVTEIKTELGALLSSLMNLHERAQQHVVLAVHENRAARERWRSLSTGALTSGSIDVDDDISRSDENSISAEGVASFDMILNETDGPVSKVIVSVLTATYDMIQLIVEKADNVSLGTQYLLGASPPYETPEADRAQLFEIDKRYCAQKLILDTLSVSSSAAADSVLLRQVLDQAGRIESTSYQCVLLGTKESSFSPHQKQFLAELTQLHEFLYSLGEAGRTELTGSDVNSLMQYLSEFCGKYPPAIRVQASRCIGELGKIRTTGGGFESSISRDWIGQSISTGDLERALQARCIEVLAACLKMQPISTAMVAMETLKALLCSPEGSDCRDLIDGGTLTLIEPFYSSPHDKYRQSALRLSKTEIKAINRAFPSSDDTWIDWCWDEVFWASAVHTDFEQWVCVLVPALLLCYQKNDSNPRDTVDFFACSQRMSCLQPRFAIALFPLIVIRLLREHPIQRGRQEPELAVCTDTWIGEPNDKINDQLSICFTALLTGACKIECPDTRAIGLCVDTLDILRRLTLHRFIYSSAHKRNRKSAAKNRAHREKPETSDSSNLAPLGDPVPWRGVPFGVGIKMDGILLANACVRARRFCSALFYAEMYADAMFGGSTRDLKRLAGSHDDNVGIRTSGSGDISGFGARVTAPKENHQPLGDAIVFLGILKDCYSSMADDSQREAVAVIATDLQIAEGHNSFMIVDQTLQPSIRTLVRLDMQSSQGVQNPTGPGVVDWMQTVGVRAGLRTYINGLTTGLTCVQSGRVGDDLRDRWFESCVMDPTLFISNTNSNFDQLTAASLSTGPTSLPTSAKPRFNENVFMGLLALARNDFPFCKLRVDSARHSILDQMSRLATQEVSVFASAETLDRLRALNDLDRIVSSPGQVNDLIRYWLLDGTETDNYQSVAWGHNTPPDCIAPQYISESVREIALTTIFAERSASSDKRRGRDALSQLLWRRISTSVHLGRLEDAEASLNRLYEVFRVAGDESDVLKLRQLEATILERGGDFSTAIRRSTQIVGRLRVAVKDDGLLADTLTSCGGWMTKHRVDSGNVIMEEFLRPGLGLARELYEKVGTTEARNRLVHSNLALGDLAFKLLGLVSARIKSPEWKKSGQSLVERAAELSQLEKLLKAQKVGTQEAQDASSHRVTLEREIQNTKASRKKVQSSVSEYFTLALQTVVEALCSADGGVQNMSKYVYRTVALWFASHEYGVKSDEVDMIIVDAVERIPTFRMVPLAHQLLARLDSTNNSLIRLATRMCVDHPYHIIAHMVRIGGRDASAKEPKARTAKEILATVKAENPTFLAALVESYEVVTEAYNCLADLKFDRKKGSPMQKKIPFHAACKQASLRLDSCLGKGTRKRPCPPCILTKTPLLRPGCDYGDGVEDPVGSERISGFEDSFTIATSGVSCPKIVVCLGAHGNKYKQLVKGNDDCRGDAVMMQVFGYVNELMMMRGSSRGKERKPTPLRVVTYSVVPLSPRNGVIEWVENSLPLNEFLTDKNKLLGAHSRYFPGEWSYEDCLSFHKPERSNKREVFDIICQRHSPVFRFFFVERFGNSAEAWYRAKMKYTQSVAVSSFVGHVLGIGDRHGYNILVHKLTGEVVHIDFGIVFEQGKTLRYPELVPFRLTRNIVDGFGPVGTEGAFTSVAETTLTTLKENADSLLTILSAVTSDPLYKWRMSREMARQKQRDSDEDNNGEVCSIEDKDGSNQAPDNEMAAAAIQKVKEKLSGYEDGTSGEQQSTRGQVQYLISAARDHDNLCHMFSGWAPWL